MRPLSLLLAGGLLIFNFQGARAGGEFKKGMPEGVIPFKEISFVLQPWEAAGTNCKFKKLEASHDYLVSCGAQEFAVHFLARPFKLPKQDSFEIFTIVNQTYPENQSASRTVSVWVNNSKGSETQDLLVSVGVLQETASLEIRATL